MKIGDLGDKSMQIPNTTVNLLLEQALTVLLEKIYSTHA